MDRNGVSYTKDNNCFPEISDITKSQDLADAITGTYIHQRLDELTRSHIPLADIMPLWYRFTNSQIEYSTDIYIGTGQSACDRTHSAVQQLILHRPDDMVSYLVNSKQKPRQPETAYR